MYSTCVTRTRGSRLDQLKCVYSDMKLLSNIIHKISNINKINLFTYCSTHVYEVHTLLRYNFTSLPSPPSRFCSFQIKFDFTSERACEAKWWPGSSSSSSSRKERYVTRRGPNVKRIYIFLWLPLVSRAIR